MPNPLSGPSDCFCLLVFRTGGGEGVFAGLLRILVCGEPVAVVARGDPAVRGAHAVPSVALPDGGGRCFSRLEAVSRRRDPQVQAPRGRS